MLDDERKELIEVVLADDLECDIGFVVRKSELCDISRKGQAFFFWMSTK